MSITSVTTDLNALKAEPETEETFVPVITGLNDLKAELETEELIAL